MRFKSAIVAAGLLSLAGAAASVRAEVVIETVTIGNPGNASVTRCRGYGDVAYVYRMGKFEVTAGEYTGFLNSVAATDTYGLYTAEMAEPTYPARGCNIQRSGSSGSYTYSMAAEWADRPVNYVSLGRCCEVR